MSFDAAQYTAAEGGDVATVTIRLSEAPGRAIDIPFTATGATGAAVEDYSAPDSVSFAADETEQAFPVTAVDDAVDDDGETITLTLDALLPGGVSAGNPATATVTLTDNDTVTAPPRVLSMSLVWPWGFYWKGAAVRVAVRFNKTVTVTGTPQLGLTIGSVTRQASYQESEREVLWFRYRVVEGEIDANGIGIAANALTLNGGTIRDSANQDAILTHAALADDPNRRVDGVAPELQEAVVDGEELQLRYDEALLLQTVSEEETYAARAFYVSSDTGYGVEVERARVDGQVVRLTLSRTILREETVTVRYYSS